MATRLSNSVPLIGSILILEGLELRLVAVISMGLRERYLGLLLPLLLSILIILSSLFENRPVNVKSSFESVFNFFVGVRRPLFVPWFMDVDGNDVPELFAKTLLFANIFCWSFIESLVFPKKPIELLERLSGSSRTVGPVATGIRSIVAGDDDCFCFLLFLSFLCFLCFFLMASLFKLSLIA